jgi:hypothetical protein
VAQFDKEASQTPPLMDDVSVTTADAKAGSSPALRGNDIGLNAVHRGYSQF